MNKEIIISYGLMNIKTKELIKYSTEAYDEDNYETYFGGNENWLVDEKIMAEERLLKIERYERGSYFNPISIDFDTKDYKVVKVVQTIEIFEE
jgi:hypothetical protein